MRGAPTRQSTADSLRTVRTSRSLAAVLPPHTAQRMRHQARTGVASDVSGDLKSTVPVGGQDSAVIMPTPRPHSRQDISAT